MERIGLLAGGGRLPIIFAEEARKKGVKVIGFAIKGIGSPELERACEKVHWFATEQVTKFFFSLLIERIRKVVMLGRIDKSIVYKDLKLDDKQALEVFKNAQDRSDYSALDKVTAELEKRGLEVINASEYLADLFPSKGVLTKREPSEKETNDVAFGFERAKELARLDIGQTIVVKDRTVVSVEAMEGTDHTIKRAAHLCGKGFVVVKVSRPAQDMRWDVPVVGPDTVKMIAENNGAVLAMEEKKMFLVDRDTCVELADSNNIAIVVI